MGGCGYQGGKVVALEGFACVFAWNLAWNRDSNLVMSRDSGSARGRGQ